MSKALQYGQQMTLTSLLDLHRSGTKRQINCHQVGEIVSFDPNTQTAEVQIKMTYLINGEIREYPLLIDCPCIILAGGDGALTMPISAGDSCLVLFNDRDMDNWYSGGQTMPPRTDRMHDFADAIALVGLRNKQNKISGYLANGVELKHGKSTIKLRDGYIDIKGNVNIVQDTVDDNSLHAYVISSYHSGTDWYRVWSDGWCEQGGYQSVADTGGTTVIPFHKEFKDTNINIQCTQQGYAASAQANNGVTVLTTSSFTFTCGTMGGNPSIFWEAKGYIK